VYTFDDVPSRSRRYGEASAVTATECDDNASDFGHLFAKYYSRLARLLYRITGDTGRAQEVAAEAFWRLYRKPPRTRDNLEGWLYRTGLHLALDELRKSQRRARYEALAALFGVPVTPERAFEQRETRVRVRRTLAAMNRQQASLVLMRSDGFTYAEIAATLALNPASVGTLLARAEKKFRDEYERRYGKR
jgi:RNA polymerase sigma-70 factor (ECF subfamily)